MSFTQMELAVAILDIVPQMDAEVVTIRIIMEKLAARFGVDLKTIRTQKAAIKQLVMNSYGHAEELHQSSDAEKENSGNHDSGSRGRLQVSPVKRKPARKANTISDESDNEEDEASEQDDEEEEADDDGDDDSEAQASDSDSDAPKHKRASSKPTSAKRKAPAPQASKKKATLPPAKKPRQTASTDSPGIAALKEMARAARLLSPRVYGSLKKLESHDEQEELIRDLLRTSGIKFSGKYPQKREIDDVRRKKDMEKDLEGIDTRLIIEDTSSRSRRARGAVSYADQLHNHPASEDEEVEQEEGGEGSDANESEPVVKRQKKEVETEEEDDDDDDAFEANDSDSSEAEF